MKAMNKGWGLMTVLLYSGWNWTPTNHLCAGISTISVRPVSGFIPVVSMPFHNFLLAVGCVSFGAWF